MALVIKNSEAVDVSFIIPAYNEEKYLPAVLAALHTYVTRISHEIILVDNGSTDNTTLIAQSSGAQVLQNLSKTIGGLRNLGAAAAKGRYLVFLDADVIVTPGWEDEFLRVMQTLDINNRVITGSRCGVRDNPSWIERHWFQPMKREKAHYMNSAHLVIRSNVFHEIGGFDESLRTGEDYEFCMRAKARGISVVNNPALSVIHEGYPTNLIAFIRREKWHGIQDFLNIKSFLHSSAAMAAVLFWLVAIMSVVMSIYLKSINYFLAGLGMTSLLCLVATLNKQRQFSLSFPHYFLIYHAYFFARGLSLVKRIFPIETRRKRT